MTVMLSRLLPTISLVEASPTFYAVGLHQLGSVIDQG